MTLTDEQFKYVEGVLVERLQEDAGKYVAQELLQKSADEGDAMSIIFGGLMKDSSLDSNVEALNVVIQLLRNIRDENKKDKQD